MHIIPAEEWHDVKKVILIRFSLPAQIGRESCTFLMIEIRA